MSKETGRARKGGEYGKNGEHYAGGQFLPSSPYTVKGANKSTVKAGSRKREIALYIWEVAPEDKTQAIFSLAGSILKWAVYGETLEATDNEQTINFYGYTKQEAQVLADKWNNGERWI